MPGPKPTHIFEVSTSSDSVAEEKFRSYRNELPTIFAYHGSKLESFHSILNYGLQQHLCKVKWNNSRISLSKKKKIKIFHYRLHCTVKVFIYRLNFM